jgi:hypothetical protein
MFNSPYQNYPNFMNVRSKGNCKCSVLIRCIEFVLSALYNICIIIIIIIINLKVDIGVNLCTG